MFKFATILATVAATASAGTISYYSDNACATAVATITTSPTCESASGATACTVACTKADDSKEFSASGSCTTSSAATAWGYSVFSGTSCTATSAVWSNVGTAVPDSTKCQTSLVGSTSTKLDVSCGGCFPTEATVQHKDGRVTTIAEVNVGDYVLSVDASGNTFFDKVFRITQHDTMAKAQSLTLKTASASLTLTPNHFVHVNGVGAEHLQAAESVKVGDMLHVVKAGMVVEEPVIAIEAGMQSGLVNVHTLHSNVVVNSVVASHFTTETTWTESSRGFAPMWYNLLDALPFAAENDKTN